MPRDTEDKIIKKLESTNANIAEMQTEMMAWATGVRDRTSKGNFFQRNWLPIILGLFFDASALGLYLWGSYFWIPMAILAGLAKFRMALEEFKRLFPGQ